MSSGFLDPIGLLLAMSGRLAPLPPDQIDCDELTAFLLALAFFLEMPAEVVTVATDPTRPHQFTHVYLRFRHKQAGQIPFDLTSGPYPGAEPMHVYRERTWPLGTPIELSDFAESDRPTAEAVVTVIATARASAPHPEFQGFLKALAQLLLTGLYGLIRQEEERRSGVLQGSQELPGTGEMRGEPYFRDLSQGDLQKWGVWLAGCLTELQKGQTDLRKLLEGRPELEIPEPTVAQIAEWSRLVLDRLLARIATSGQGRI